MTRDERERIASLETEVTGMKDDIAEIKADVKTLLAALNQQRGFIAGGLAVVGAVGAAVGTGLVMVWNWLTK